MLTTQPTMKTILLTVLLLAPLALLHAADPVPPKGFQAIFNGKDLTGWHGLNPHSIVKLEGEKREAAIKKMREEFAQHWHVENGELVNVGTGPYATTDKEFGDMELLIEYKTVPHADSGIYLRGMPQVQIWDINQPSLPEKPDRNPNKGSGGLFNNTPKTPGRDPLVVADKPFGEWNAFRIRQIGAKTWVWLNDKVVVDGAVMENYEDRTKPLPAKGPIMLQTHGGEIRWRNVFVHEIDAEEAKRLLTAKPPAVKPTLSDVPYGTHERQVLDFYQAKSDKPTPLLFYIHGGGWVAGDKKGVAVAPYLAAGISVVSINYRYNTQAQQAGIKPPVQWPLHDAARALQFVRSKAAEWNIDKQRIGASGGSAGACSSLWLAFHNNMADAKDNDPIAHESTRLWCAAVVGAQTTLDPQQMKEWTPNSKYGGHAFGFMPDPKDKNTRDTQFAQFLAHREDVLPWIKEYSPFEHVSSDDPPIYMIYSAPPALGQDQKDPTHTSNFGVKLQEKLKSARVECELVYPDAPDVKHATAQDYLIERLKAPATK